MPKIVFTETRVVQDEHVGTDRETRFEAGYAYELPAASAARWLARGLAVAADLAPGAPVAAAPAPGSTADVPLAAEPSTNAAAPSEPDAPKRRRARERLAE